MTIAEARELFAYSSWANGLMFDAAQALSPAQLSATIASSFPSVRGTLGHIAGTEWIWLRRWRGDSPTSVPAWVDASPLPELRGHLGAVEAERDQYLAPLGDGDLERIVQYRRLSGEAHGDRLADLVRHVVNHSTYHRGQVATQLRHLGVKPPGTDLILYLRSPR
jgi:uncharacterized damage-inducible protein DinB